MADELNLKRIIELQQKTEPAEGDCLAVDNASRGTSRIMIQNLLDPTFSSDMKAAPAKETKEKIDEVMDVFAAGIDEAIDEWMDEHPEATTTVQDGAITIPKLNNDVLTGLNKRVLYVSAFNGDNDNEVLQNAIDTALSMESCTLIIDKTLNITQTINIVYTNAEVQALVIQGIIKDVPSSANVFHGDANPTLRNNMIGCINCNVSNGIVFNVKNRNDTSSLVVRDCVFWNSTIFKDSEKSWQFTNNEMKLFYMNGCISKFFNNTCVGFDYFIYSPSHIDDDSSLGENWTGDYAQIEGNHIYTAGHGILIQHGDASQICRNGFIGLYGVMQFIYMRAAHGFIMDSNMYGMFYGNNLEVGENASFGIDLLACVGVVVGGHGENNKFPYLFSIGDNSVVTFTGNQHTTTRNGRIIYARGNSIVYMMGNSIDTVPLVGQNATLIDVSDLKQMPTLNFSYVDTAQDWDIYKSRQMFVFDKVTTNIRSGYSRGFFESKFNSGGTLGIQVITWLDGKKSTRTCWYGTFTNWYTES